MLLLDSPRRWSILDLRGPGETGPDVLVGAPRRELHRAWPASHEDVAVRARFHSLPLQEHWLGAPLAAHHAHRLTLHDLGLRIDARASTVAEAVPHDLGEVTHELVVALELVALDADDGTFVRHADQQIATLGVEERGD